MKDMLRRLETLRNDAAECAVIGARRDKRKARTVLSALSTHISMLADQVEQAISVAAPPDTFLGRKNYKPFPRHTKNDEDFGVTS